MAVPGTGSTNQSLTFAAAKRLAGKAHTSNLKEVYNETIPSNVQIDSTTIFGEVIPQNVTTTALYSRFSASVSDPYTVEYVEFYVESISGTTYDANTGSFGDVGFGGGDEEQPSGPHGYQLVLTSSYETLSSGSWAGTGYYVNDQVVHESNGGLQLINPSFGPQTGNNYGLTIYTDHPDNGGLQIPTTSPIEWLVDYFNGVIFVQDYKASAVPKYARGFIYVGKTVSGVIDDIAVEAGNITVKDEGSIITTSATSLDFVGDGVTATNSGGNVTVTVSGVTFSRRAVSSTITASVNDVLLGVSGNAAIDIRLPSAGDYGAGQYFTVKDESGAADTKNIRILTSGSQTIDGVGSVTLESPYSAVNIYSDGTSKFFIY